MPRFFINLTVVFTLLCPAISFAATETTAPPSLPVATPAAADAKTATPVPKRIRVGYADLVKIAEKSDAGKIAKTHFEAKADRYKSQLDTKQKLLEKQKTALEAKLPAYTPEQRTAKIREYEKKVEELRQLLQKADKEMRPMQEELLKELYGKIEVAARVYGEANGFSIILEKRELLFMGKEIDAEDVTEALIKELNGK